jgi:hypothetical protein
MTKANRPSIFSLSRSSLVESTPPFLDGSVDYAILSLGLLVLIGWHRTDGKPTATRVRVPGVPPETAMPTHLRHIRDDITALFEKAGKHAPFKAGFVCVVRISGEMQDAISKCIADASPIEVGVELDPGIERRFAVVPIGLAEAMSKGIVTQNRLQMAHQAMVADGVADTNVTARMLISLRAPKRVKAHIDVAQTANQRRVVLSGWLEGADHGEVLLLSADLTTTPQPLDGASIPRQDVVAHLRSLGIDSTTSLHGFVAVAPIFQEKKYQLCRVTGGEVLWSDILEIEPRVETTHTILANIRAHATQSVGGASKSFHRLANSALGHILPVAPGVTEVREYLPLGKEANDVRTSIVVPFYGDSFYLLDHLMAQSRVRMGVEWIFVCDDPRLSASMLETISARQTLINQPTRLVLLAANGGFAHANNIGAKYAQGEFLLLMNSDIYCEQFDFIDHGVALLDSKPDVGCVGFSLQYEDGTIQHDGMEFERSRWLDGLWVCEHRNKGMPQDWSGVSHTEVAAVTAALVLIRRSDFADKPVFDPVYIVGDFEDADLCLTIRETGRKIAMIRTPGLFHLERQSLRHTGSDDARMAITHLNCLTFNHRWGAKLSANEPHAR